MGVFVLAHELDGRQDLLEIGGLGNVGGPSSCLTQIKTGLPVLQDDSHGRVHGNKCHCLPLIRKKSPRSFKNRKKIL